MAALATGLGASAWLTAMTEATGPPNFKNFLPLRYCEASNCRADSVFKFLAYANVSIPTATSGLFESP